MFVKVPASASRLPKEVTVQFSHILRDFLKRRTSILIAVTLLVPTFTGSPTALADQNETAPTDANYSAQSSIALGGDYTCVVLSIGEIKCWGKNNRGQLGDGTTTDSSVPVTVLASGTASSSPVALTGVTAVSAGYEHTCALLTSKQVRCWGNGFQGRLGNGDPYSTASNPETVLVSGVNGGTGANSPVALTDVTAISAGSGHTCALLISKQARCWGQAGRLGNGDGLDDSANAVAVLASGTAASSPVVLTDVTTISAGGQHTCALLTSKEAKCWGSGSDGALGVGVFSATALNPVRVLASGTESSSPVALTDITAISAEGSSTCAMLTNTEARCWGYNGDQQICDGSSVRRANPVTVLASGTAASSPVALTNVTAISMGQAHTCVLLTSKEAKCWGDNANGRLGDGTVMFKGNPVAVLTSGTAASSPVALTNVTAIAAAINHTCAILVSKQLSCWGNNTSGQLGDGTTTQRINPVTVLSGGSPLSNVGVTAITPPSAPTIDLIFPGDAKLTVNFNSPSSNGGSAITNYEYRLNSGSWIARNPASTTGPIEITGLTNGTLYSVQLRAVNAAGGGSASSPESATPAVPITAPTAPTITSIVGGDRKLTVNFSAPTSNGGAEITNYEHRFRGDALWTPRFPASTLGPIEITGLINGQSYEVEIRAANSAGSGDASTYVSGTPVGSATTPGSTPSTGTTPRAPGSPKTTTPSNTTSAPLVGDYTNAVPGITVTDPTVYRSAPKEVAGNSAIILLTPLQNKVLDIVSKTPSVCLPSDDDLVFIDEGKCIAEVVNAKTRNALRTLRTTVVKDDISELKVGNEVAVLSPLYFVAGSFEFKPQSLARLAKLKDRITSAGSVLVAGHSGILLGNTPENIKLASDRANAAVKELKARGAKGPFSIASVGALDPATTLKTQAAQDKNRRVVIVLIP